MSSSLKQCGLKRADMTVAAIGCCLIVTLQKVSSAFFLPTLPQAKLFLPLKSVKKTEGKRGKKNANIAL